MAASASGCTCATSDTSVQPACEEAWQCNVGYVQGVMQTKLKNGQATHRTVRQSDTRQDLSATTALS